MGYEEAAHLDERLLEIERAKRRAKDKERKCNERRERHEQLAREIKEIKETNKAIMNMQLQQKELCKLLT